jgi:hypothetical protein
MLFPLGVVTQASFSSHCKIPLEIILLRYAIFPSILPPIEFAGTI